MIATADKSGIETMQQIAISQVIQAADEKAAPATGAYQIHLLPFIVRVRLRPRYPRN